MSEDVSREEEEVAEESVEQTEGAAEADASKAARKAKLLNIGMVVLGIIAVAIGSLIVASLLGYVKLPSTTPDVSDDNIWKRIKKTDTIIVGTAADYPPFSYYTDDYQIDGFDIALIRELGSRLDAEVQIKDMAFDGLVGALQIQQIDVAIAAMSITPDRDALIDFSDTYFISEDAILANRSVPAATAVTSIDQLAGYRVGVQTATLYELWVTNALVDTGKTAVGNIHSYAYIDQAIADLGNGQLDFVVLDLPQANAATAVVNVMVVGSGMNRQQFGIGIGAGQSDLQKNINAILQEMQEDGTISALALDYIGINPSDIVSIPTPDPNVPTSTPPPTTEAIPCVNGMEYAADLNLDDNNMVSPPQLQAGQSFRKGWRIKNTGTCTWDSSYALVFSHGNIPEAEMGGVPTAIQGEVSPGDEYEITVQFFAPFTPNTYQSFWTMRDANGEKFGNRIWAGIEIPSPATPTPAATQTPSPNMSFTADRTRITVGECVAFAWNVTNANASYFYQQGQEWQSYPVPANGNRVECPPVQATYELRAEKADGSVEVRQIVIYVDPVTDAPHIERFTVDPAEITAGQCVDIRWQLSGDVQMVNIYRNGAPIQQGAPLSGTRQDCPAETGILTYHIEAKGTGGVSQLPRTVKVNLSDTPIASPTPSSSSEPTAVPTAQPPAIYHFIAAPESIDEGACVTVSWSAGGGADSVRILRNDAVILDGSILDGSAPDCLSNAGSYVYRLEAYNGNDQSVQAEQAVTVNAIETLPLVGSSWTLAYYYDGMGAMISVLEGTTVTAVFDNNDDGNLNGSGGCNNYQADYNKEAMSITNVKPTSLTCNEPESIMQQEALYLGLLPSTNTYQITGRTLQLLHIDENGNEQVLLEYDGE